MKRKRFAVEQIAGILKQREMGTAVSEICMYSAKTRSVCAPTDF
jgi:hypothetical protein